MHTTSNNLSVLYVLKNGLGRQLYFHGVLSFITLVFERDLDSLSHFFSLIRNSSPLACQLTRYIVDI